MKFKVGDIVRFTRNSDGDTNQMQKGDIGKITGFKHPNTFVAKLERLSDKAYGQINRNGLELVKNSLRLFLENGI